MAKTLSQAEADALFSAISSGKLPVTEATEEETKETAHLYDWRCPNRLSRDQLRVLERLHDNFASYLGRTFSALHREVAGVKLISTAQLPYSEFINSLPNPSCSVTFTLEPLGGLGIINFGQAAAFSFVDSLFGGRGKAFNPDRDLTTIEKNLMYKVAIQVLDGLQKSWAHLADLKVRVKDMETNPQFIQTVLPTEIVISFSFDVDVPHYGSDLLNLCYPYLTLEPVLPKLSTQHWIMAVKDENSKTDMEQKEEVLGEVYVNLKARLGETNVTVYDLIEMQIGDVLRLDTKLNDEVMVFVEENPKFLARPGLSGKTRAIQIVSHIEKGGED